MAVSINGQYAEYTNVKESFPESSSLTGTISSANNGELIIGVGTLFTTELQTGDWILIKDEDEFRQIRSISSNTELYLYKAFTNPLSGLAPNKIPRQSYKSISWKINSEGTADINGFTFDAGSSDTLGFDEIARKRPDPILINVEGDVVVNVQFQY